MLTLVFAIDNEAGVAKQNASYQFIIIFRFGKFTYLSVFMTIFAVYDLEFQYILSQGPSFVAQ